MRVTNTQFLLSRIVAEVDLSTLQDVCSSEGLNGFARGSHEPRESADLLSDVLSHLKSGHDFADSQLGLMRRSYDALVNYESMRINHKIQARLLYLSWVLFVLTGLLTWLTWVLVPQETKTALHAWFQSALRAMRR